MADEATKRREPLVEDQSGHRPGHPELGRESVASAQAARPNWLNTSTTTVRQLIERGELDGYWWRTGMTYRWHAYVDDVERFVAEHGRFPHARSRSRRSDLVPRSAGGRRSDEEGLLRQILAELRDQRSLSNQVHLTTERQSARLLVLEDAVRRLGAANSTLTEAVAAQEDAARYLRKADEARSRALRLVTSAGEQSASVVSAMGVPDFPLA
jgi:hypothetical protein